MKKVFVVIIILLVIGTVLGFMTGRSGCSVEIENDDDVPVSVENYRLV